MNQNFHAAEGGCACGAVRFRISGPPKLTDICHCRQCQRHTGGPYIAWLAVPAEHFRWTRGEPDFYRSSPKARRYFCGACGGALVMMGGEDESLHGVAAAALDEPTRFPPGAECWVSQRWPWVQPVPGLPQYPKDNPDF